MTNCLRHLHQSRLRYDALAESPATATVTSSAGGHLTSVAYSWRHPADGPQDGLLVISAAGDERSLVAVWGDSWHQQPMTMSLSGSLAEGETFDFGGDYGDGWAGGSSSTPRMPTRTPAH